MLKNQLPNQNNLLGFVPAIVVDNLIEKIRKKEIRKIPERQTFNSVVMFADISGFTNLSEKLSTKGFEGAELLAFALTRYMEFLVKSIGKSGGDIFKFAGDAMIIIWPPPQHNSDEELTTLCRQAIQSSLDIQSKLHEIKLVEDIKLSVKIGFGVGQVTILHVGGVFSRAEYLAAGDPLKEAFECEHLAPGGGYIIISENFYKRVMQYFEVELIDNKGHGSENFYYIKKVKKDQKVKMKADALLLNTRVKPSDIEAIRSSLVSYIPAAVLPFIEIDEEKWSHELRRLSIMFCNLGIDLSDAQSIKGLDRIQIVIETVQKCVYKHQGSLNKLLMDDKGSTLMIIFGLYPMAHQDDPVRAVLSGIQLIKELKKINCSCSIGVATGVVFAGVVGTSGSRREFSVLGDKVNLSARFMQAACKEKDNKILVDETTKTLAENKIAFKFVMKQPVKGKTGEIPFFQPIDPEDDPELNSFPYNIRTHMFTPQKNEGIIGSQSFEMVGKQRDECLKISQNLIEKFLKKPDHNVLISITGSYGIGKSLFIRNLLNKIYKMNDNLTWKYGESAVVLTNTLNSSTKDVSFNGWRSISQQILLILALRTKTVAETLLIKILENETELLNNIHLTAEILNLKLPQVKNNSNNSFENLRMQEKDHKIRKKILLKLFQSFLEEQGSLENSRFSSNSHNKSINTENISLITPPLIIILEDMQDYDTVSWSFTKMLLRNLKKIVIITSIRDKYCEIPPSFIKRTLDSNSKARNSGSNEDSSPKKSHFDLENLSIEERLKKWASELEENCDPSGFYHVELSGFSHEETWFFVKKLLNTSEVMIENEPIKEISHEISTFQENKMNSKLKEENSQEETQKIIRKFMIGLTMRTEGKPLDILQVISNLQKSEYLKIEGSKLIISQKLKKLSEMSQFLTIEPPLSRISVNGEILDRLETHAYLLMKAAAIIGEEFDLQTLMKVNPFQLSISNEKLRRVLNYLGKAEFIEILDETEHNVIYRFVNPLMREIIYNRMLFSQRRQLHRFVAEAMQGNPLQNESDEKSECQKLIYHWCLAENLDQMSWQFENSQFSNKAKRSLIVKKISSLLSKNQHSLSIILKSGSLDKRSDHGMSWSSRFLVLNCKDLKYYYSEADFKKNTDFALGVISLKHIFKIFYLDEKETKNKFAFVIYTGSWQKKNKEMGVREFYFSSTDYAILETWTTYLEFLRAKAIYDDFVSSFGKISFPLSNNNDRQEADGSISKENRMNLSRMTNFALENNRNTNKSTNMQKKNTLSAKLSVMKGINKQIQLNTIQEVMASNANQENAKKLKERTSKFMFAAIKLLISHISEAASNNSSSIILGQNTQILRKIPLNIEENLIEDEKNMNFKTNLTDSQDLTIASPLKKSIDSQENEGNSINNINNNSSIKIEKKKSGTNEDFVLMNALDKGNMMDLSSVLKIKSNLEMIKEVEEHSLKVSISQELLNKANNPMNKMNNSKNNTNNSNNPNNFEKNSHFGISIEEKQKNDLFFQGKHRSTLDNFEDCDLSPPFKGDSAKPSTILTRQELDNLQLIPQMFKDSNEEIIEQIEPFLKNETIQVKFGGNSRLNEINEGKSCDLLISETVMVSKKPHKNKWKGEESNDFNIKYKEFEEFEPVKEVKEKEIEQFQKKSLIINIDTFKETSPNHSKKSLNNAEKREEKVKKDIFEEKNEDIEDEEDDIEERKEKLNRIPKVLMRQQRKKNEEKKKKNEDFLQHLPFSVFPQNKPKANLEEKVNPNYGHINFYRKL